MKKNQKTYFRSGRCFVLQFSTLILEKATKPEFHLFREQFDICILGKSIIILVAKLQVTSSLKYCRFCLFPEFFFNQAELSSS